MSTPLILLALMTTTPALAQTPPWVQPGGASVGEQHRYQADRQRAINDANAALARQQQLETRLTILELQSARQAPLMPQSDWRALRTPEQERALREAATERRQTVVEGMGQIDAWLDRAPRD